MWRAWFFSACLCILNRPTAEKAFYLWICGSYDSSCYTWKVTLSRCLAVPVSMFYKRPFLPMFVTSFREITRGWGTHRGIAFELEWQPQKNNLSELERRHFRDSRAYSYLRYSVTDLYSPSTAVSYVVVDRCNVYCPTSQTSLTCKHALVNTRKEQ